ncbi:hypothetical protein PGT21_032837 [Puccinia graminis f. sp. tritici]|uniref:Uncharacterized protein n=1 Tax=Puccinia graminis f. sp. tritici TaxID=56615 RepID=A0A5B0RXA1_PUCGR|nr:hypothetical protein PGT21_032837 [Puccinia graminis f. sp. tritici]KAA1130227.1 hypothetical protein PGTUg99_013017 [Puccinia graminis f. sp. tritici]
MVVARQRPRSHESPVLNPKDSKHVDTWVQDGSHKTVKLVRKNYNCVISLNPPSSSEFTTAPESGLSSSASISTSSSINAQTTSLDQNQPTNSRPSPVLAKL